MTIQSTLKGHFKWHFQWYFKWQIQCDIHHNSSSEIFIMETFQKAFQVTRPWTDILLVLSKTNAINKSFDLNGSVWEDCLETTTSLKFLDSVILPVNLLLPAFLIVSVPCWVSMLYFEPSCNSVVVFARYHVIRIVCVEVLWWHPIMTYPSPS